MEWKAEWVTCENSYDESWKRILEYANIELAIESISEIHGVPPDKKRKENYRKQAEQVRVCLIQAKEYFEAAKSTSLVTQPNHLYYGAVALSTACMLIRGDGEKSLDKLRENPKNKHHGLDLALPSRITTNSSNGFKVLEEICVKVCQNGHFGNWYTTLPRRQAAPVFQGISQNSLKRAKLGLYGEYEIAEFETKIGNKKTILDIAKRFSDMQKIFKRYHISTFTARGKHHLNTIDSKKEKHIFLIEEADSPEVLDKIIEQFSISENAKLNIEKHNSDLSAEISIERDLVDGDFFYPCFRQTLDNEFVFFQDDIFIPEVVDLFMVSYALSMLSRYYPDIWISFLEISL